MAEDPGHKAMLYFLEVLMNSNGPLSISQMAGRFGSRTFSAEMRTAAGGNEVGLRKFLLKYPSLFTVNGNLVSLCDGGSPAPVNHSTVTPSSPAPIRTVTDLSLETEAVLYFQNRLAKKDEKWVQVKSLAGHLSQSSSDIRQIVGPQNEFKKFLMRHPHVFEVQGELVSLRDSFASAQKKFDSSGSKSPAPRPRSLKFISRSHSSPITPMKTPTGPPATTPTPTSQTSTKPGPITMTANEYKAVMFLKSIIEKKGPIKLHNLTGHFSQAAEGVRNTIGWTKMELEEFIKKNSNIFGVEEDETVVVKKSKVPAIVTGSRPLGQSVQTLTGRRGKIFHVAKLWGIIDLGKHEHVFFDRSIYHKEIDDFQREFRVGEYLNFNAVLAPKDSRAKWRATMVWKDGETNNRSFSSGTNSPTTSIEDELNRLLPSDYDEEYSKLRDDPYADAAPSGTGVIPVWNFRRGGRGQSSGLSPTNATINMITESCFMYASSMEDIHQIMPDYVIPLPDPSDVVSPSRAKYLNMDNGEENGDDARQNGETIITREGPNGCLVADAGCQTISTGEILATQLYHEGLLNKDGEPLH